MFRTTSLITVFIFITGCTTLFQPQVRNNDALPLPSAFTLYGSDEAGQDAWWETFGSEELNGLVNEALTANFDIRTAMARLKQAHATLKQTGADLKPTLSAQAGAETSRTQTKTNGSGSGTVTDSGNTFTTGLTASYEIDLWGRLSSLRQSELLEYRAARDDLEAAAVTVAGEVVTTWIDLLAVRQQIIILTEQVTLNENMLTLQKFRFAHGKSTALDVAQQVEALATAKAKLPLLQLSETRDLNAMAVLLGRSGAGNLIISENALPQLIILPRTGIPADLLAARPDVRAAGLRLQSQDWQVSAARANRLPSLTLSASATFSSDSANLLFNNWIAALAGSITGPIFDGGYRKAEVERTRAVAEEYVAAYAQTVAEAIRDVEDCMATESRQTDYLGLLEAQLNASQTSLKDSRIQYMNGQDNYLDYLTAWTSVQDLDRQLVDEKATLIKNRVDLYRTLGGDWTRTLIQNSDESRPNMAGYNSGGPFPLKGPDFENPDKQVGI